jgi:hypothetical protein
MKQTLAVFCCFFFWWAQVQATVTPSHVAEKRVDNFRFAAGQTTPPFVWAGAATLPGTYRIAANVHDPLGMSPAAAQDGFSLAAVRSRSTGSCPQGSAYADGCQGAQAGGSILIPNFFNGYAGVNYGDNRPPWNVAGVDYPVGYSGSLKDPTAPGNLPDCAVYSAHGVSVNADVQPCTVSHLDFSLHNGICVRVSGSGGHTAIFDNDKFGAGSSCNSFGGIISVGSDSRLDLVVQYSEFADNYRCTNCQGDIGWNATGTVTVRYSSLLGINCRVINVSAAGSGTFIRQYNYLEGIGGLTGCHGETVEYNTSLTIVQDTEAFNNYYVPASSCGGITSCDTALSYVTSGAPRVGTISNSVVQNNVMITRLTPNGKVTVSSPIWIDTTFSNNIKSVTVNQNYIDPAGSYWPILVYPPNGTGSIGSAACSGNKLLTTGAPITGTLGRGSSIMACS